jgi:charged multivesicular body protein 4A/B
MSLFTRIFGKNSKEKPPTPQEAIQRIREVEELLGKKSAFLEKKIDDELETAKKHGTKNKRCKLKQQQNNDLFKDFLKTNLSGITSIKKKETI